MQEGRSVRWPGLPVTGVARSGTPAGGDFVTRWSVGTGYRGPGYLTAAAPLGLGEALASAWYSVRGLIGG